jgi:hypothetical protein
MEPLFGGAERIAAEFGVRGVEVADFVCWAIKSKYEDEKETWFSLLEKKTRWAQFLYFDPQEKKGSQHLRPTGANPAYACARFPQDLRLTATTIIPPVFPVCSKVRAYPLPSGMLLACEFAAER